MPDRALEALLERCREERREADLKAAQKADRK
jgi:cation transport protein ChaC